jgi:hypothetical protein
VLEEIDGLGTSIFESGNLDNNSGNSRISSNKCCLDADFYYEGGSKYLRIIEDVMKSMRDDKKNMRKIYINQISSFAL